MNSEGNNTIHTPLKLRYKPPEAKICKGAAVIFTDTVQSDIVSALTLNSLALVGSPSNPETSFKCSLLSVNITVTLSIIIEFLLSTPSGANSNKWLVN